MNAAVKERNPNSPMVRHAEASGRLRRPVREIGPQEGPQTAFSRCTAEILIYGGQAGGGKSWGLCFDPLRYVLVPGFEAVIFRRSYPELKMAGGLWDASVRMYAGLGAEPNIADRTWKWPNGGKITFRSLQFEDTVYEYDGSEIPYLGFDELISFTEKQFFYMLSRNRGGVQGVVPQVRATTNPDADSWVKKMVRWWIDPNGFAIPERSGVIRWIVRTDLGEIMNFPTEAEASRYALANGDLGVKSLTFIHAKLSDNKILQDRDPKYEQNLKTQDRVHRARLLEGNWNIRHEAGKVFRRPWFKVMEAAPAGITRRVRYWDMAATEGGGDYTAGALLGIDDAGQITILDMVRGQWSPHGVQAEILKTAAKDGRETEIWIEQEPGSAGKFSADTLIRALAGFLAYANKKTGSKLEMARPLSAQAEAGNIQIVRAEWNDAFLAEMEAFSGDNRGHDDQVDAASGAFSKIILQESTFTIL